LLPACDDIGHDSIDQTETFDGAFKAILAVCDLGLHIQQSFLDDADQGSENCSIRFPTVDSSSVSKHILVKFNRERFLSNMLFQIKIISQIGTTKRC
jgi:hypothetical protein